MNVRDRSGTRRLLRRAPPRGFVSPSGPESEPAFNDYQRRSSTDRKRSATIPESDFISHSQMTMTVHPMASNASAFSLSRWTFRSNFSRQKSVCDFGRGRLHLGQRCQKQPFTNIAILRPGYAMSGLPGTFFQFRRYPG